MNEKEISKKEIQARKKMISNQVRKAVTPVIFITKVSLCDVLGMSRPTLDARIEDGDFSFKQCQILRDIKIIK